MNKKWWIFAIVLGYLVIGGGGFWAGKKWGDTPPPVFDNTIVDSLMNVTKTLEDSLAAEKLNNNETIKEVIKYRDIYHSITITEGTDSIIIGLREIVKTPIHEEGR